MTFDEIYNIEKYFDDNNYTNCNSFIYTNLKVYINKVQISDILCFNLELLHPKHSLIILNYEDLNNYADWVIEIILKFIKNTDKIFFFYSVLAKGNDAYGGIIKKIIFNKGQPIKYKTEDNYYVGYKDHEKIEIYTKL